MTQNSTESFALSRMAYPDPFLDVASTKLPKSRRKLLELCYIFGTTHPQIAPIVKKLAKYPITRLIISNVDSNSDALRQRWRDIFEDDLGIYSISESVGLDFFGYGNCFITVHKPFERSYTCKTCDHVHQAGDVHYYLHNDKFQGKCNACGQKTILEPEDHNTSVASDIEVVRLKPQNMYVRYNELTGKSSFYYEIPQELKGAIDSHNPDRETIDETPLPYVRAAMEDKKIKFSPGSVLHLKEPSLSGRGMQWGNPIILAGLKDAYLNQVYKKADESLANERAIPARFVFPQANTESPLHRISLGRFSSYLSNSIRRWRRDKNAIMPSPFPVGTAEVGGDAHRFSSADLRQLSVKEIIGSTGVPEGFLAEGMTWSGGSVQLRMLQNMLMSYSRAQNRMVTFVMKEVAAITGWPEVEVRYKPFKMADDMQKIQILVQLAQMKVVSYKEVLDRLDLEWENQHKQVQKETEELQSVHVQEQLLEAKTALEAAGIQSEAQMRHQAHQAMKGEIQEDHAAALKHLQRQAPYFQAEEQAEQERQQQQQQEQAVKQRAQQAEVMSQEAKALKDRATAEQKGVHADIAENNLSKQVPDMVEAMVQKILDMPPEARGQELEKLHSKAPNVAIAVEERLDEVTQRERAQTLPEAEQEESQGKAEQKEIEKIIHQLRTESKNAKEMAEKVQMLEPKPRQKVLEYLHETDPTLTIKIMQHLGLVQSGRGGGGQNRVNMKPFPEQKPSSRTQ